MCCKPVIVSAAQKTKKAIELFVSQQRCKSLSVIPSNAQILGTRERQEDALACSDFSDKEFTKHGGYLAVVCDGMGGHSFGDQASQAAARSFLKAYEGKTIAENIPDALIRSLNAAQQAVCKRAVELGKPGDIGTTLVAVVCHEEKLYWISVGDSRAYLIHAGQIKKLTNDHNFGAQLDREVREKEIDPKIARQHPHREHLTSYLGGEDIAEIDLVANPRMLSGGDLVLVCTDGVFNSLDSEELTGAATSQAEDIAEAVVREVAKKNRSTQDNASVVAMRVENFLMLRTTAIVPKLSPAVIFWLLSFGLLSVIWFLSR